MGGMADETPAARLAASIRQANLGERGEEYADLQTVARWELVCLWSDLEKERRCAINGVWSMACDGLASRIVGLSHLVGVTEWGDIDLDLLETGVYQQVLDAAGLAYEPPDMAQVAELRAYINRSAAL